MKMKGFLAAVAILSFSLLASAQTTNKYVGLEKCKLCHKSESKGNQYGQWLKSKHSQAYNTLATPKAKEFAEKAGITDDPQKAEKCLKCHSTAFGVTPDMIVAEEKLNIEDAVQCESCHGAGEKYWKIDIMKVKDQSIANGLVIPKEETCVKCHNSESPAWKGFNYEEARKQILHPRPKEEIE